MQLVILALLFALASAGKSSPARMAIIAMTTRSSINVNPVFRARWLVRILIVGFGKRVANLRRQRNGTFNAQPQRERYQSLRDFIHLAFLDKTCAGRELIVLFQCPRISQKRR